MSAAAQSLGAEWWPLQMARELDDAILMLRTNDIEVGIWIVKYARRRGAAARARRLARPRSASTGSCAERSAAAADVRTRLDVSSRCLFALVEPGSCFAGSSSSWRSPPIASTCCDADRGPALVLSRMNFGLYADLATAATRLAARFCGGRATSRAAAPVARQAAQRRASPLELGLVTAAPDELDWDDEVRLAIEERVALSPDALTGMERTCASAVTRPWRRASSGGSRRGRTGSSFDRMRSASMAR